MYLCVCICMLHGCGYLQRPEKYISFPKVGVTGGFEVELGFPWRTASALNY